MKSIKILIYIVLIMPTIVLAETWDNIYQQNTELFDNGFVCQYVNEENDLALGYLNVITLTGNNNGFYVKYKTFSNDEYEVTETKDESVFKDSSYLNIKNAYQVNQIVNFQSQFAYQYFLDSIINLGQCPNNIYISGVYLDSTYYVTTAKPSNNHVVYNNTYSKIEQSNNSDFEEEYNSECKLNKSYSCSKIMQANYKADKNQFIQISINNYGGKKGYCLVVSNDSELKNAAHNCVTEIKDLEVMYAGNSYKITKENVKLFFIQDADYKRFNSGYFTWKIDTALSDSTTSYWTLEYSNSQDSLNTDFEMPDISLTPDSLDCVGILGRPDDDISKPPAFYLQTAFTVMKYVAIVILIVFTIMDYASAVAAQDDDAIKKATSKLVTRLIICVILFVLPTLIEFLFKILDIYGDASHCKIN